MIVISELYTKELISLLSKDEYISRNDYKNLLKKYKNNYYMINEIEKRIENYNRVFVAKKLIEYQKYFDNIFKKVDKSIILDEEQRTSVLVDEDYCLVIAGAGAGKTTTLAAKVKCLVDIKHVNPEEIIVISYTNKAVKELKDRISKKFGINAKVTTFHKLGYELIGKATDNLPNVNDNNYRIIEKILTENIYKNKDILTKLIYFLSCYLDIPEEALKYENLEEYIEDKKTRDYTTLKTDIENYNRKMARELSQFHLSIKGETLRSTKEVNIANFLYINGIDYEYEKPYKYKVLGARKPYLPDFFISQGINEAYIEYFGLYSKNNSIKAYDKDTLRIYEKNMNEKIKLHNEYGTKLIDLYYDYEDGRDALKDLDEKLKKFGFVKNPLDNEKIYNTIIDSSKGKYIYKLIGFMTTFISKFKTLGMKYEDFDVLRNKTDNVRNKIFIDLAEYTYLEYQRMLKQANEIDFDDMINDAIDVIDGIKNNQLHLNYKYIIIDEYQDIAKQRFNLTKKLADATSAKVIAVGDDWQSIFAFAGSTSEYFLKFREIMGYAEELKITHTYRNSQELIDIAGDFVQKNDLQIKKRLISKKHLEYPIKIYCYADIAKEIVKNKIALLNKILNKIAKEYGEKSSVLILGRYGFEEKQLINSEEFQYTRNKNIIKSKQHPDMPITFLTVHKSKGLGYDNVILMSAANDKFGFPSKIEDDPIMKLLKEDDELIDYPEERRLFYVALTRTKNEIFIMAPQYKPSEFVQELIENYPVKSDERISKKGVVDNRNKCPICGFPLRHSRKKFKESINLWICSNEPEICDFMTNSLNCKRDIHYCPKCDDGYMIVMENTKEKENPDITRRFFMGCTNYKVNGCNYTEEV